MERTTFLKNYRIRLQYDGTPYEPDRNGPAISYEAVDERTGEPVSVTLIPAESIDPSERQHFEENALAAQKLRPEAPVAMAAYGDYGAGYIGTDISYSQGGYETGIASRVGPGVEKILLDAMAKLLK